MKLMASVAPARSEIEAGVVAKADQYDNFTCYFKAFRESAPSDLSLSAYWGYPKDMEWMLVIAIKLAFIAVFKVIIV